MMDVIIPVLLTVLLGPGMGQLYNKEYKKALYLLLLALVVVIGSGYWFLKALMPYLPSDPALMDPSALQKIIKEKAPEVVTAHQGTLFAYQGILVLVWLYSVVDAY